MSKLLVHLGILHGLGQVLGLASSGGSGKTGDGILGGVLELVSGRISDLALLGVVSSDWEEDHLGLVIHESLDVLLHHVGVSVVSSVVDSDSDGSSEGLAQLGLTQLSERETSAVLDLGTILLGVAEDDGSQGGNRSSASSSGFLSSFFASDLLVGGSIEETLDSSHPVFSQMLAREDIIVTYHVAY